MSRHEELCSRADLGLGSPKVQQRDSRVKYCSDRCRTHKPNQVDRQIECLISALLNNEPGSGIEKTLVGSRRRKGDPRSLVSCEEIESLFFTETTVPEGADVVVSAQKLGQQRAERRERVRRAARRAVIFGLCRRPGASVAAAEDGHDERTLRSGMSASNQLGQTHMQMCEAVVDGVVVEPSFAKGDWCIRFRQ